MREFNLADIASESQHYGHALREHAAYDRSTCGISVKGRSRPCTSNGFVGKATSDS